MSSERQKMANLIDELRAQEWTCTLSPDGHRWKCVPPDKARNIVFIQAMAVDLTPCIRQLRNEGLQWPPPERARPATAQPVFSATPFGPKPHPSVSVSPAAKEPAERPKSSTETDESVAFIELREAREYEKMAAGELRESAKRLKDLQDECARKIEAASRERDRCAATYQEALASLSSKKRSFDKAFEPSGAEL